MAWICMERKCTAPLCCRELCKIEGIQLDPDSVLLSRGDRCEELIRGDEGRTEDLPLSGSADPACE